MQRQRHVETRQYKGCQIEILDDGGDGWVVAIHSPREAKPTRLSNRVPHGLSELLALAQEHVDRRAGSVPMKDYP